MRTDKLNLKLKQIMGERVKKMLIKLLFPWRNKFILFNISNRAKSNCVNLNYWSESKNLGDLLSPIIVNYMLSLKKVPPEKEVAERKHLYAVGSVLTSGIQDATVWGSGVLNASLTYRLEKRKLDIRAVRGPFTRAVLIDYGYEVPEVYGDPAILLPEIYTPEKIVKKYKFAFIFHKDYKIDTEALGCLSQSDYIILDICTDDYKSFIDKLSSVETVISSSLHGIILAESYGVKAVLLKPQIDILKYYDYYYSTGRLQFPIATDLRSALDSVPAELPDFTSLRSGLKAAFPYDIYS